MEDRERPPGPGARIREQRLQRRVSLRELARRVGVSAATLSAVENGRTGLSVTRLQDIARALEVPVGALVEPESRSAPAAQRPSPGPVPAGGGWRHFAPLPIDPVLSAAIRAFVATGYHGASVRAVARLAGMSVPGVYHHYPSKQQLLVSILDITMSDLIWRLEEARAEGADPVERVALVVEALALYHARRADLAFIGASEMRSLEPENYRRIARQRDQVQQVLDDQIAQVVAHDDLPTAHIRDAGKAIATMCTSLPQWFHPDGPTSPEEIAAEYARFALRIIGHA